MAIVEMAPFDLKTERNWPTERARAALKIAPPVCKTKLSAGEAATASVGEPSRLRPVNAAIKNARRVGTFENIINNFAFNEWDKNYSSGISGSGSSSILTSPLAIEDLRDWR